MPWQSHGPPVPRNEDVLVLLQSYNTRCFFINDTLKSRYTVLYVSLSVVIFHHVPSLLDMIDLTLSSTQNALHYVRRW